MAAIVHRHHQQQQQHHHLKHEPAVISTAEETMARTLPVNNNSNTRHRFSYFDPKRTALGSKPRSQLSKSPSMLQPINPWRELEREDYVIASAVKGTAQCGACLSKIAKGAVQLGAFYMHEDKFTLVRWYHQRCVVAPDCLRSPMDLCGIEDLRGDDLEAVLKWLGCAGLVKDRSWTA